MDLNYKILLIMALISTNDEMNVDKKKIVKRYNVLQKQQTNKPNCSISSVKTPGSLSIKHQSPIAYVVAVTTKPIQIET